MIKPCSQELSDIIHHPQNKKSNVYYLLKSLSHEVKVSHTDRWFVCRPCKSAAAKIEKSRKEEERKWKDDAKKCRDKGKRRK